MFTLTLLSKLTKAVVLNFFPHGRFWQFVYKENVRCTRLMQRSLQVVIRQKFVLWMLQPSAHPPILMPKEFQSLVYILHFFLGSINDRLNEFVMLIYLLCNLVANAQPYTVSSLIYITLFQLIKKYFRRSETREKKNKQYNYIHCRKY